MSKVVVVVLLLLLVVVCSCACAAREVQVAVIGGGMGGASAAHFLRQIFGREGVQLHLQVFEGEGRVGGRASAVQVPGVGAVETGGSIIVQGNEYVRGFAEQLGLRLVPPGEGPGQLGVWNEEQGRMTLHAYRWQLMFYGQMFWRYGVMRFWAMHSALGSVLARWNRLYPLQAAGRSFASVRDFLEELGLLDMTQQSFDSFYAGGVGAAGLLHDEIVYGVAMNNYCQDPATLHALVGMIAIAPLAAGPVLAVEGGFQQIPEGLLRHSGAQVHTSSRVSAVLRDGDKLILRDAAGKVAHSARFDYVVVAAPLETAGLDIQVPGVNVGPRRTYKQVHVTLARGVLRPERFGLDPSEKPPSPLLVAKSSKRAPFNAIGRWASFEDGAGLYKFFSDNKLDDSVMEQLFSRYEKPSVIRKEWKAYPRFQPPEEFPPVEIAKNVFYINSIENAASAFEVMCIWARNVAFLIAEKEGVVPVPLDEHAPRRDEL